ncbi:MAG: transcription antitermination factor NusB [Actinomycetota bacterium]
MSSRRMARRRAIDVLYQADVTERGPGEVLAERDALQRTAPEYTHELVRGVVERVAEIDRLLGEHAEGWTVARMPAVDRAILRLAAYEILYRDDVPDAVAINEAVEAAKELSTEASRGFVNGLLGKIAQREEETA